MIRGHQHTIRLKNRDLPVSEAGQRGRERNAMRLQGAQASPESDLAQRYDHPDLMKQRELLQEERTAALKLGWSRLIVWRRTSNSSRDIAIREVKAVVAVG
jgi:hypothetical protein